MVALLCAALPGAAGAQSSTRTQIPPTQAEQLLNHSPERSLQLEGLVARGSSVLVRDGVRALLIDDAGQPRVIADDGREYVVVRNHSSLSIRPVSSDELRLLPPRDVIPDGEPGVGTNDVAEAWLIQPTDRYAHAVLGDNLEAGAMRVVTCDGRFAVLRLTDGSVFEDIRPKVVDLDRDGRDEIVTVKAKLQSGGELAIYNIGTDANGRAAILKRAAGPNFGRPNRWLNPIGAADMDGDGRLELAVVSTPHIGGTLILYRLEGNRLVEVTREDGFSNHAIGSPEIGLARFLDLTGDGQPELIVPSDPRTTLRIMDLVGGRLVEIGALDLPAPIETDLLTLDDTLMFGLENDTILALSLFFR